MHIADVRDINLNIMLLLIICKICLELIEDIAGADNAKQIAIFILDTIIHENTDVIIIRRIPVDLDVIILVQCNKIIVPAVKIIVR